MTAYPDPGGGGGLPTAARRQLVLVRAAAVIVAAAGLVLPAAGCGGSQRSGVARLGSTTRPSGSPSGESSGGGSAFDRALAYANCLRTNGVPNWPDPINSRGGFDKSKLSLRQLGVSGSRLEAGQTACRHLLPNGGAPPNQSRLQRQRAQALSFAQCVRSHGVPGFPDPGSDGRIPDPATAGVDQGSPKFQAANQACRAYRPPYVPSNADYDAWARTHG